MSALLELPRTARKDISPAELRVMIKTELGYNTRQVSVSSGSSWTYLTITIRDAKVETSKIQALAKSLHTWSMDQSDYCEGQSVRVVETETVRAERAAPFVAEITAALQKLATGAADTCIELSTGAHLLRSSDGRDVEVFRFSTQARGVRVWAADALRLSPSSIVTLALDAARV
jgi:hypothetical protein